MSLHSIFSTGRSIRSADKHFLTFSKLCMIWCHMLLAKQFLKCNIKCFLTAPDLDEKIFRWLRVLNKQINLDYCSDIYLYTYDHLLTSLIPFPWTSEGPLTFIYFWTSSIFLLQKMEHVTLEIKLKHKNTPQLKVILQLSLNDVWSRKESHYLHLLKSITPDPKPQAGIIFPLIKVKELT